eukprot:s469_g4.t1
MECQIECQVECQLLAIHSAPSDFRKPAVCCPVKVRFARDVLSGKHQARLSPKPSSHPLCGINCKPESRIPPRAVECQGLGQASRTGILPSLPQGSTWCSTLLTDSAQALKMREGVGTWKL